MFVYPNQFQFSFATYNKIVLRNKMKLESRLEYARIQARYPSPVWANLQSFELSKDCMGTN